MPPPRQPRPQTHSTNTPQPRPPPQSNIFRRITSKFRSNSPQRVTQSAHDPSQRDSPPQRKHTILRMPPMPKAPTPVAVQNDFTSAEQRQAALRARGLVPANSKVPAQFRDADGFMMSLSEQEAEIDRRRAVVIPGRLSTEDNGESEARKIREAWLVKQTEAGSSSTTVIAEEVPRTSDAMERASKDGLVGEKNPVQATFVQAKALSPKLGDIGTPESPLATVEDFHTAPNTPPGWDHERRHSVDPSRPMLPLRNSNPLSGSPSKDSSKSPTSRRPSTDLPTPRRGSTSTATSVPVFSESPRASLAVLEEEVPTPVAVSPAGTMRARKEKPPPIVVTSHRPSQDAKAQHSVAVAMAAPDLEASISDGPSSVEQRGRPTGSVNVNALSPPLAQDLSNSSSGSGARSRTTTIPALSPTRTVSSSGASSSLPTPTTTSCARDASISRGSTSHSSDNGHETASRPRRGNVELKAKGPSGAGAVIMEEYSETEPSSEGGEFGVLAPVNLSQPQGQAQPQSRTRSQAQETAAPSRTPRIQVADDSAAVKQNNRKSFSLFGKKSLDIPRETRTASSMSNLRRAFTSSKPRPKLGLDAEAQNAGHGQEIGRKRSKMFDASHMPPSPTFPPTSYSNPNSNSMGHQKRNSTGVGPRPPRQAVAPTIHSRGSILLQAHTIEDEESRRLSEMAFLT
ncbi:hypothetical protein C8Q74DRAFT_1366348 [Fomes fomentarius]|nr:hypothetical protein C8Q74DRAFT_1366348 [Fomes fomentarius]